MAQDGLKDGVFDGTVRYEATILVERDINGSAVTVLTDKPRKGDRIVANELNTDTGEMQRSTKRADEGHATPARR